MYSGPLKPFDQAHPVRGYFNDPRISGKSRAFHFGIDIAAPNDCQRHVAPRLLCIRARRTGERGAAKDTGVGTAGESRRACAREEVVGVQDGRPRSGPEAALKTQGGLIASN